MKLLIDDANVQEIRRLCDLYPIDGVTTNPSILAKTGRDPKEVLTEMLGQQPCHEGCLSTSLCTNQRRHTLIAMNSVHLEPMRNSRAKPYGQEAMLFCADTRQSTEQLRHMIPSVPLGQAVKIFPDRVIDWNLFGVDQLHDLRLRTAFLNDSLALGSDDDAVQCLLREDPVNRFIGRQGCKLHLSVQHVATEEVIVFEEIFDSQSSLL